MQITADMMTGKTETHLAAFQDSSCLLHSSVIEPFTQLKQAASDAEFDLQIASSFRSFDRQLAIWNAKATGERLVLDDACQPLDLDCLSDRDKVFAILRWSALPGASRHHWGTDMDVWDGVAVDADYSLQLIPAEYEVDGPFYDLSGWLGENAQHFGFYRPYANDQGGIAPELWHLSYQPIAQQFEQQLTTDLLREVLDNSDLQLKATVLSCFDEIFERYVRC